MPLGASRLLLSISAMRRVLAAEGVVDVDHLLTQAGDILTAEDGRLILAEQSEFSTDDVTRLTDLLLTESGDVLITQSGDFIVADDSVFADIIDYLLTQDGDILMTQDGRLILDERSLIGSDEEVSVDEPATVLLTQAGEQIISQDNSLIVAEQFVTAEDAAAARTLITQSLEIITTQDGREIIENTDDEADLLLTQDENVLITQDLNKIAI